MLNHDRLIKLEFEFNSVKQEISNELLFILNLYKFEINDLVTIEKIKCDIDRYFHNLIFDREKYIVKDSKRFDVHDPYIHCVEVTFSIFTWYIKFYRNRIELVV